MPRRHDVPPVLAGRSRLLIAHFWRNYNAAVEQERELPHEQRHVLNMGPSYAAVGWLLYRENKYRRRKGSDPLNDLQSPSPNTLQEELSSHDQSS